MSAEPLRLVPKAPRAPSALPSIEPAERRKHALVNSYWHSLKGDRAFPSIWDLDPFEIADAGPNSVMLDLSKDSENPEIFVGDALRYDGKSGNDIARQEDAKSLLSCVLNHYRGVLGKSGPIAFEDKCPTEGNMAISCFGTLFPFSSTGHSIDYVYGLLSWKHVVLEESSFDEAELAAAAATAEAAANDIAETSPEAAVIDEMVEESGAEDVTMEVSEPEEAVAEAAEPEPVAEASADLPVEESGANDVVMEVEAFEEVVAEEPVVETATAEDVTPVNLGADDPAAPSEAEEMVPEDSLPEEALPEQIVEIVQAADPEPEAAVGGDPSPADLISGDLVPTAAVAEAAAPAGKAEDLRSHFTALGSAVFAAVRHFAVSNDAVSYDAAGKEVRTADADPEIAEPIEAALPEDAALEPPVEDLVPDEPAPEELAPDEDAFAQLHVEETIPEEPEVLAADDATLEEVVEPIVDEPIPGVAAAPAVIVPMAPFDSDGAALDEPVAEPAAGPAALGVFMPMVGYDDPVEEPVAQSAPVPEPEFAARDAEGPAAAETGAPPLWLGDPQPAPSVTGVDLRKQLAVAQAIAAAAPDADYHSRGALFVALGHAYDLGLATEAQPEVYRAILQEAGLEFQAQAPMGALVELVFGPERDRKRLNEFAALLSRARATGLPAGALAAHLEFLEACTAIVAPR